jgi:hypothetical protein
MLNLGIDGSLVQNDADLPDAHEVFRARQSHLPNTVGEVTDHTQAENRASQSSWTFACEKKTPPFTSLETRALSFKHLAPDPRQKTRGRFLRRILRSARPASIPPVFVKSQTTPLMRPATQLPDPAHRRVDFTTFITYRNWIRSNPNFAVIEPKFIWLVHIDGTRPEPLIRCR